MVVTILAVFETKGDHIGEDGQDRGTWVILETDLYKKIWFPPNYGIVFKIITRNYNKWEELMTIIKNVLNNEKKTVNVEFL